MSVLPLIATELRTSLEVRFVPIATNAPQQIVSLFDHLVGARGQRWWHSETNRFSRLEINDQTVFVWCLHREVGRLLTFENAVDVTGRLPMLIDEIGPIGNETAVGDGGTIPVDRRQFIPACERND
jgi:hypothetical protein